MFLQAYLRWARRCIGASLASPVLILACTHYLYYVYDAGARVGGMPSTPPGRLGAVALLTGPVFFSGIVFSTLLRGTTNLAGAMVGGMLENNALHFGHSSMYLMAIVLYAAAGVSWYFSEVSHRAGTGNAEIR